MKEYRIGDVININPKKGVKTWCCHHIYILDDRGWRDTYWLGENWRFTYDQIAEMAEHIYDYDQNIADFEKLTNYPEYENTLDLYARKDRLHFPIGGASARDYIRKGSLPIRERVLFRIARDMDSEKRKIRYAADKFKKLKVALEGQGVPDAPKCNVSECLYGTALLDGLPCYDGDPRDAQCSYFVASDLHEG